VDVVNLWDRAPAWDPPQPKTLEAVVSHNEFHLNWTGGSIWGGVLGVFAQDVLVANNKFSGTSSAAIYLPPAPPGSSGWTIIGNNFQDFNAAEELAPVWLGPLSSNCTVVGSGQKTNVLDQGTGNIVVGVNNMKGNPPGPEIHEAMKRKLEILSQFR
jgi:hypothetical protein